MLLLIVVGLTLELVVCVCFVCYSILPIGKVTVASGWRYYCRSNEVSGSLLRCLLCFESKLFTVQHFLKA